MILTFHEIGDESRSGLYKMSTAQFEEHLRVIQEFRGDPGAPGPAVQVTFDDGHVSHHRVAMPILERYQTRATFFVTVGQIGADSQHLTWSEVQEIAASGHDVQSHTWSHLPLTNCDPLRLQEELLHSRETLAQRLARPVQAMSIPYGRHGVAVLKACAAAGYEQAYTSDPWIGSRLRCGIRVYGRLSVRSTLNPSELRRLLTLNALAYFCQRTKSEGKEAIKILLGNNFYNKVWLRSVRRVA